MLLPLFVMRSGRSFDNFERPDVIRHVADVDQYPGVQFLGIDSEHFVLERVQPVGSVAFLTRVHQFQTHGVGERSPFHVFDHRVTAQTFRWSSDGQADLFQPAGRSGKAQKYISTPGTGSKPRSRFNRTAVT